MANEPPSWISSLRDEIRKSMNFLEDDEKYTITKEDLDSAWNVTIDGKSSRRWLREALDFFAPAKSNSVNHWVQVVSILIWIKYEDPLDFIEQQVRRRWVRLPSESDLPPASADEEKYATFKDEYLPFTKSELSEHLFGEQLSGMEAAKDFYRSQFAFLPIVLRANQTFDYQEPHRLPLIEEQSGTDGGAYGLVTKVKIARGHYLYKAPFSGEWRPFEDTFYAAKKEFESGSNWAREYKNLEILRSSSLQHDRIMQSLTSGSIEPKYYLFFPWADLDLDMFLNGNYLYDGQEEFVTPLALMQEAIELLGALQHLHENVRVQDASVVFSHLDLKPNNILIMRDEQSTHPLGKWMITDFGISWTEPQRRNSIRRGSALDLYTNSKTPKPSAEEPQRYPGHYQPPEAEERIAHVFKDDEKRLPGDKSDIWSYGCVILDVLAFALGGSSNTTVIREVRRQGGQCADGQYRYGRFYRVGVGEDKEKFLCLAPAVREWFHHQTSLNAGWLRDIWNIVATDMLRIFPEHRKSAREVIQSLGAEQVHQSPRKNIWSSRGQDDNGPVFHMPDFGESAATTDGSAQKARKSSSTNDEKISLRPSRQSTTVDNTLRLNSMSYEAKPNSFRAGWQTNLRVSSDQVDVALSMDCSGVLYRDKTGVRMFPALQDGGSDTKFTSDKNYSFPENESRAWDQALISGRYLGLRTTFRGEAQPGEIQTHEMDSGRSQSEVSWTDKVENRHVNAMCISSQGFVAFRYSRKLMIFHPSGTLSDAISRSALDAVGEGIKDVAFDRSGQIISAISSRYWFVKNLADDSETIVERHEFCRGDYGTFEPVLFPFMEIPGFIVHDTGDRGRCAVIIPSDRPQTAARGFAFSLSEKPHALAITPDNKRLVYVTSSKLLTSRRHKYVMRSRAIKLGAITPIADQDDSQNELFVEKKFKTSIATSSSGDGYVVVVALANGRVEAFDLP